MRSTMMDVPLTIAALMRYGTSAYGDREVVTCTPDGDPAADLRRHRRPGGPAGERAARPGRGRRPAGRHADVEQRRAPRGLPGHPVHGRGPAHPEPAARPGDDRLHRRRTRATTWSSSTPPWCRCWPRSCRMHQAIRHVIVTGPSAVTDSPTPSAARSQRPSGAFLRGPARGPARLVRLAGPGRAGRGGHVLHQRHHRPPEGRGLQPPLDATCTRWPSARATCSRCPSATGCCRWCPMFHANAWGLPYAAVMAGADLVMPDRFLQPEPLVRLIEAERPTIAGAVPTIWNGLLHARPRPRRGPVLAAAGAVRRLGGAARAAGGLREGARASGSCRPGG